ncbi:hypothetical protein MLD38_037819 [Melastoma candidum]|uniref:Uncharacterized protein n=1 Tax=Melastoma candidum TaxID=119954 RepID=A0ACB9LPH3_9MYRT|nr:hypothetical protein MLD38_037819 [Melastoma candidum]
MEFGRATGTVPEYGAIFMSDSETRKECLERRLFGLPSSMQSFVSQVKAGMILFLFEYESKRLYGVFQACSDGAMNIVPHAYSASGKQFPAQVKMKPLWHCAPLSENVFRDVIKENYFTPKKFNFGLSEEQVCGLVSLFERRIINRNMPRKQVSDYEMDANLVENVGSYRESDGIWDFAEPGHPKSDPPLGSYNLDCYLQDIANDVRLTRQDTEESRAIDLVNAEASVILAAKCSCCSVSERYPPEDVEATARGQLGRHYYAAECSESDVRKASYPHQEFESSVQEESCRSSFSYKPSLSRVSGDLLLCSSRTECSDHPMRKACLETKLPSFETPEAYCPSCSFDIRGNSCASCFDVANACLQEFEPPMIWSSDSLPSPTNQWNILRVAKYSPLRSSSCAHCTGDGTFHGGGKDKHFKHQMGNVQGSCLLGCTGFSHCLPQKRKRSSVFSRLSSPIGNDVEGIDKSDNRDSSYITSLLHHQQYHLAVESANDLIGMNYQSKMSTVEPIMGADGIITDSAPFDSSHASDLRSHSENVVDATPLYDFRRRSHIRKDQAKSLDNPPSYVGTPLKPSGRRKLIRPDFSKKETPEQKPSDDDLSKSCPAGSFDADSAIKDIIDDHTALKADDDVKNLSIAASPQVLSQLVAIGDKLSDTNERVGGKCNEQDTVDLSQSCQGGSNDASIAAKDANDYSVVIDGSNNVLNFSMAASSPRVLSQSVVIADKEPGSNEAGGGNCNGHDVVGLHGNQEQAPNQSPSPMSLAANKSSPPVTVPVPIDESFPSEEHEGVRTDDGERTDLPVDGTEILDPSLA